LLIFAPQTKDRIVQNDPELSGKYLGTITKDFVIVAETLKEASYQMRARKISDFPVFPVCKVEQPIGELILAKEDIAATWNFYISMLDELIQRKLITEDRMHDFIQSYKDPEEFCCLLVVDEEFVNFVYIPFPED
jgi:hypothetical protein